jgi:hypothetical protein
MAELHQFGLFTEDEDLEEETLERTEMGFSEIGDGIVIGMVPCGEYPEGDVFMGPLLYLSGGRYSHAVGIEEQLDQHGGMIGRLALQPRAVRLLNLIEIEFIDHIRDKVGEVTLRQPFLERWRQKEELVGIVVFVVSTHGRLPVFSLFYRDPGGFGKKNIPTGS